MKLRLLVVVAAGLMLGAEEPKKEDVAAEVKKFEGTWVLESMVVAGMEATAEQLKMADFTLVVKDGKFALKGAGQEVDMTMKLDPGKAPKTYDAEGGGQKTLGIYKFDGGKLTVCFVPDGKDRPKEFKSAADSQTMLQVWKKK